MRTAGVHLARGDESYEQDYRIVRADGEVRWLYDFTVLARDEEGTVTHLEGYVLDVTERRRAEEEREEILKKVLETQKLESVGILAGGIAHDFNNLLTSVIGNLNFALDRLSGEHSSREFLEQARVASNRASGLTQQLLAYAGKVILRARSDRSVPAHPRDHAPLEHVDLEEGRAPARPGRGAPGGGRRRGPGPAARHEPRHQRRGGLRRGSRDRPRADERPQARPRSKSRSRCSDSGCGMDEETVSRIFDPFFTTKFTGRGLGLAAALGIVRAHGGKLEVQSELGAGSTFEVLLPASDLPPVARPAVEKEDLTGSGTILIADDEPAVLGVAGRALREQAATTCSSPRTAAARSRSSARDPTSRSSCST